MRTTAIFSYKGGTGKTTTAINLGAELAARGKRVLLVDADGQANLSDFFDANPEKPSVYDLLTGDDVHYAELVQRTRFENISIIPSGSYLAAIELQALEDKSRIDFASFSRLCVQLAEDDQFDFVLFDCPPSFSPQSAAALKACMDLVVPVTLDNFAVSGLRDVRNAVGGARRQNLFLQIAGVLITRADKSAVSRDAEAALRGSAYPVFTQTIRDSRYVPRMTFDSGPLREFASWSSVAQDYAKFCDEYLGGDGNG